MPAPSSIPQPAPPPPFFDKRPLRLARPTSRGLLAGMRIRKKLIFLHTGFSVVLALILLLALRPTISEVVERAEMDEAKLLLETVAGTFDGSASGNPAHTLHQDNQIITMSGAAADLGIDPGLAGAAMGAPGRA